MPNAEFFATFGLFVRREFLDDARCDELRREIIDAPGRPSTVTEELDDVVDDHTRRTVLAQVPDTTKSLVRSRFEQLTPEVARYFETPLNGCQPPQLLRYREGDYFRPHTDHESEGPEYITSRRVSAIAFLNDERDDAGPDSYSGGALTFFGLMGDSRGDALGFPLVGEKGLLVAFRSDLLHSVTPVTRGERFTVANWFTWSDH